MTAPRPTFTETDFRKARRSEPDLNCVHIARRDGWVEMRDTKKTFDAPDDHRLVFTAAQFDDLQAGIRAGDPTHRCVHITPDHRGHHAVRSTAPHPGQAPDTALVFTEDELRAFYHGVTHHEFDETAFAT